MEYDKPRNTANGAGLFIRSSSKNYFNSLIVADETGLIRNVSPESVGSEGQFIQTEEAKTALASKKPYLMTNTNRLIVFMSEPIIDKEGVYRGDIGGTLYLQEHNILNMIFGSNPTDEIGSYFYIAGSDGHALFHRDTERIGKSLSANQVVRKLEQGQSGYEQMVSLRGGGSFTRRLR